MVGSKRTKTSAAQAGINRLMCFSPRTIRYPAPLSPNCQPISDRVLQSCFAKSVQPQPATIARATGFLFELVARPSALERRPQFGPLAHDLALAHSDHRCLDTNRSLRPRSLPDYFLEGAVIALPAVRVP